MRSGAGLDPCACDPAASRGRRHPEAAAPTRTAFQRDRDRVIHSTAFRRLVYKTQVQPAHENPRAAIRNPLIFLIGANNQPQFLRR